MKTIFDDANAEVLADIRTRIGIHLASAMAVVTLPMVTDRGIRPLEMTAAILDAHCIGVASAVAAAANQREHFGYSRAQLQEAVLERIRQHLRQN